jgi:hypothetical protein
MPKYYARIAQIPVKKLGLPGSNLSIEKEGLALVPSAREAG